MFRALFNSIGIFYVGLKAAAGELSLWGAVYKLWFVIIVFGMVGSVLDIAFRSFYAEAVKRLAKE